MNKFRLIKIVSGGQTGVDLAALKAARDCGLDYGGWCPPDSKNEAGNIPEAFKLRPTAKYRSESAPKIPRSERTEQNVRDSDGTLIVKAEANNMLTGGTSLTLEIAEKLNKPTLVVSAESNEAVSLVNRWIEDHEIEIMNVAGPSEGEVPGIEIVTLRLLTVILKNYRNNPK